MLNRSDAVGSTCAAGNEINLGSELLPTSLASGRARVKFRLHKVSMQVLAAAAVVSAPGVAIAQTADQSLESVVVTATRQEETLGKVPISVTAFSQAQLDSQNVQNIADLSRLAPGITFNAGAQGTTSISIRGIASGVGDATTGVYIDDTPVQIATLGYSASNPYPALFDLSRVEVLRGPQGTLFGAGSEGGTIRFILPQPSLDTFTSYARLQASGVENGGNGYQIGAAVGGPIVDGKLGFRADIYFEHDPGWINKVAGVSTVTNKTGTAGPNSISFAESGVASPDTNWGDTTSARVAITYKPLESLSITPSVIFQKTYDHDALSSFWPEISDYSAGVFNTPQFIAAVNSTHTALPSNLPANEPLNDQLTLPAVKAEWEFHGLNFISNTSFLNRLESFDSDYTALYARLYAGEQVPLSGDRAVTVFNNSQNNFTQEARVQSTSFDNRLNWTVGVYYSDNMQRSEQQAYPNFLESLTSITAPAVPGFPAPAASVANGAPFGPGYNAFVNYYGVDLDNQRSYWNDLGTDTMQLAGYAQGDFNVTDALKVTAGVRIARDKIKFSDVNGGPVNNLNQPHGLPCDPGTGAPGEVACVSVPVGSYAPGTGPFTPVYTNATAQTTETPFTPKLGVSYQVNDTDMVYASATKGYRVGGAQAPVPGTCDANLVAFGFVNSAGLPQSPTTYRSDSLWSYELGSKDSFFNNLLQLSASGYYINWSNIQTAVSLNQCSNTVTANLGNATGRGADFQGQIRPFKNFLLGLNLDWNKTSFNNATVLSGRVLYTKGSAVPNSGAPFSGTVSAEYDFTYFEDHDAYARADYTFTSPWERTGSTDPGTVSYDPMVAPRPQTTNINLRIGQSFEQFDVALFMNNALGDEPHLSLSRSVGQPVYTDYTFIPRTVGAELTSHF